MRWIVLAGLMMAGCGTPGEACSTAGETRCTADAAEICEDGEWTMEEACDEGQTCMVMMDGSPVDAHCM